ncbi:MAG: ATP-dependent 6-phosphofructokinase [Candidatus Riflebacteria bacterium]|nr:ATP-dependent 6-phosphofructokinase [Candidatus Riflebacteria bacterium]
MKKIAVNTGGGDAPGLNAVIRAVTLSALREGWEVVGIPHGYAGLLDTSKLMPLTRERVRGITSLGGTILGTANKGNPFEMPEEGPNGVTLVDRSDIVVDNFHKQGIDALVCIGGDGSMRIGKKFMLKGMPMVCVPKTIDNDVFGTAITFGFDTAVSTASDCIDKLQPTAEAHERVFVVEVMGRYVGWIALNAGISTTADVILLPEIPFDLDKVCAKIRERDAMGRKFSIVVVAEGAKPIDADTLFTQGPKEAGREIRLGGISGWLAAEIARRTGKETRSIILGHLQRGGHPTTFDRLLCLRMGAAAVRFLKEGLTSVMTALHPPSIVPFPVDESVGKMKCVPLDCDTIQTGRAIGVCFGD